MEIAFAFIVLCESSGIYRQTVKLTECQRDGMTGKLTECQRDGMTGGRMPEYNTSYDGRIIRLRQVKKRKFIQVKMWTGMIKHDYLFIWLNEDVTTRMSDRATV